MSATPRTAKNNKPHPLQGVAMAAFAERSAHDATSLGYFLAGAHVTGGARAYRTVAKDLLGYMESQGLIERDDVGWFHLKKLPS
jgi:hypothetical protein